MSESSVALEVPAQFAIVEEGIYRSDSVADVVYHPFIAMLRLKTILILHAEQPSRPLRRFAEAACNQSGSPQPIRLIHLGLRHSWRERDYTAINHDFVQKGIDIVLDKTNHPLLIMDVGGYHETGILVAILRKLQHWAVSSILFEYRAFAGDKKRYAVEQLIELFDASTTIVPQNKPLWWDY